MKSVFLSALFFLAASPAFADNWSDHCKGQPAAELVLHYPANIVSEVTSGKVTASVRKGLRCNKAGDILTLQDPQTKAELGKVKLEEVFFSTFNAIQPKAVARSGAANMVELQNKLVSIYGDAVKSDTLTEFYFSFVK